MDPEGIDHRDGESIASSGPPSTLASLPNALYAHNLTSAVGVDSRRTFGGDWASRSIIADSDRKVNDKGDSDVQIIRFSDPGRNDPNGRLHHQKAKKSVHDGYDSDVISEYIGHYGVWQFVWTFLLCLFQIPCTFEIFVFVFQVSLGIFKISCVIRLDKNQIS